MQLFVEAYNILNHFNVYSVRTTQYSLSTTTLTPLNTGVAGFGVPQAAPGGSTYAINMNGARVFQVGAKIGF